MTRIPLSINDRNGPYISPGDGNTKSLPEAWIAIVFGALFVLAAGWHWFLLARRRSYFTWLFVASSIVQCFSLVEFAYSTSYPLSTGFLVFGTLAHWLSPTLLTIATVVVFGRSAWAGALSNPPRLEPLWGFLRWNTFVVTSTSLLTFGLLVTGCIVVVSSAPDGNVDNSNHAAVNVGNGVLKAALVLQLLILTAFTLLVWRFQRVSQDWDVQWDERRKFKWTWKKLITMVLASLGLLFVRQFYYLVRFLLDWTDQPWLCLLFDAGPVFLITVLFIVYHPGKCLPKQLVTLRLDKQRLGLRTQVSKMLETKASASSLNSGST